MFYDSLKTLCLCNQKKSQFSSIPTVLLWKSPRLTGDLPVLRGKIFIAARLMSSVNYPQHRFAHKAGAAHYKRVICFSKKLQVNALLLDLSVKGGGGGGNQLLHVDPVTYRAEQWSPDPGPAQETYLSLATFYHNIPHTLKGENYPPEVGEVTEFLLKI